MKKRIFILVAVFSLGAAMGFSLDLPRSQNLPLKEFAHWVNLAKSNSSFVILDVRTPEEFEAGFIERAVNLDFYSKDIEEKISRLDKNKIYLLYCRSGNRSGKFLNFMQQAGISKAYHLVGGFNEWQFNGYPIKRKK